MTKQRRLILDVIRSSGEHLTADEIFIKARKILPSIAIGTVYRNLRLITEDGTIRRIVAPNEPDRFDRSLHPHEHIICQHCKRMSDIAIADLKEYLQRRTGIEILGYDLSLRYICDECKKEGIK